MTNFTMPEYTAKSWFYWTKHNGRMMPVLAFDVKPSKSETPEYINAVTIVGDVRQLTPTDYEECKLAMAVRSEMPVGVKTPVDFFAQKYPAPVIDVSE